MSNLLKRLLVIMLSVSMLVMSTSTAFAMGTDETVASSDSADSSWNLIGTVHTGATAGTTTTETYTVSGYNKYKFEFSFNGVYGTTFSIQATAPNGQVLNLFTLVQYGVSEQTLKPWSFQNTHSGKYEFKIENSILNDSSMWIQCRIEIYGSN